MAKHLSTRLLRPPSTAKLTTPKPPPTLRRDPHPLPPSSVLYRKPIHPGPRLPPSTTNNHSTIHHGQHIYLYLNIHTKQILYSLTRHLDNASALAQLPFFAKKTQLPNLHLRKDLWVPFALASFPSRFAGLDAYRKLREFRRLHETSYPLELIRDPKNPKALLPKKARAKVIMDQKANSVADLAAVLCQLEQGPSQERRQRWERASQRIRRIMRVKKLKAVGESEEEQRAIEKEMRKSRLDKVNVVKDMEGCEGVEVQWVDVRDAEMAERWPREVVHKTLKQSRYTAAYPGRDVLEEEKKEKEKKERLERGEEYEEEGKEAEDENKEEQPSKEAIEAGLAFPKRTWREFMFGPQHPAKKEIKTLA